MKGDFEMKRKILFTMLCIGVLSIGTIAYASFIQTADTSILSDREMKQISGKCACYEYENVSCRIYGDVECVDGSSCPSSAAIETDNFVPAVVTYGPTNNKVPYFSGYVDCYQYHYITDGDVEEDHICDTSNPIPPSERGKWAGWWYSCYSSSMTIGEECQKCSVGGAYGPMYKLAGYNCKPV